MNLGRKDDISPMQENVVLSDSEGESERAPPPLLALSPPFFVSSVIA